MRARTGFTTRHLALAFLSFVALAAAWTAWRGTSPSDVTLLPCLFHTLTDHPCPGCGMTRACIALFRGDLAVAWSFHPFAFVLVPLAVFAAFVPSALRRRSIASFPRTARGLALAVLWIGCLALWVARAVA